MAQHRPTNAADRYDCGPPAPRPCASCPYQRDVPSQIWDQTEYAKLPGYDGETWEQSPLVFYCHQFSPETIRARMCAGWVGVHDARELLALRLALIEGRISDATFDLAANYVSPVPLFRSGAEAAKHGTASVNPSSAAQMLIAKITATRPDIESSTGDASIDTPQSP